MSTDQSINPNSSNQPQEQAPYASPREQRRAARHMRHEGRGGAWVGGAILILLGAVFLMQNMGVLIFDNWWALFILLPAVGAFGTAWNTYNRTCP